MGGLIKGPATIQEERDRLRDRNAELVAVLEYVADRAEGEWRGYSKEAALYEIATLLRAAAQEAP